VVVASNDAAATLSQEALGVLAADHDRGEHVSVSDPDCPLCAAGIKPESSLLADAAAE
jgi:hypothetical protein